MKDKRASFVEVKGERQFKWSDSLLKDKELVKPRKYQKTKIKEWFAEGKALSSITASGRLGITQLSARFCELKKEGYKAIWGYWENQNGVSFKVYFTDDHPNYEFYKENYDAEKI